MTTRGRTGYKTFWAEVLGTGVVTATVAIYGCRTISNANGVLLATITLSGTTQAHMRGFRWFNLTVGGHVSTYLDTDNALKLATFDSGVLTVQRG